MTASSATPIVVLASGRGSNFEAIANAVRAGKLAADIRGVVSDQPAAGVLEKARALGIPAVVAGKTDLLAQVQALNPRFVVLAGYMRLLSPAFLDAFDSGRGYHRVINVHPSLLPAFPGLDSYAQALHHGAKVTGVTIHLVDGGLDSGAICAQEAFDISDVPADQTAEVERRGLAIEHRLYPATLGWILPERFAIEKNSDGRLRVRPS